MGDVQKLDQLLLDNREEFVRDRRNRMTMSQEPVELPECRKKLEEFKLQDFHESEIAELHSVRTPGLDPYQTNRDTYDVQIAYELVPESLEVPRFVINGAVEREGDYANVSLEEGTETTIPYSPSPSEIKSDPDYFIEKILD